MLISGERRRLLDVRNDRDVNHSGLIGHRPTLLSSPRHKRWQRAHLSGACDKKGTAE
jgi:hypothetical protein